MKENNNAPEAGKLIAEYGAANLVFVMEVDCFDEVGYDDVGYKMVHACQSYSRTGLSDSTYFCSEEQLQAGDILQVTNESCIELAATISSLFKGSNP